MAAVIPEKMVDITPPSSSPPISQSMDDRDSSSRGLQSTSPVPEVLDRDSNNSTYSPSRQLDSIQASRVEEYRQLFRLPPDEVLIQDFNCALQENFLLQGHMYLFAHYVCFYSNLFGFETKKIIPFHEITSVRRAKAVAVFPTAIEIFAGGKKYFFTSFLFRDEAFRLINEGWGQCSSGTMEITDQQEPKSDTSSQETESSTAEELESSRQSADESGIIESDKDGPVLEVSENLRDGEPEISPSPSGMQVSEEDKVVEAAPSVNCLSLEKSLGWEPEDADAPVVPDCYTKVAESKFPIQVEEFFNLFFSNNVIDFHESFHRKCGDKDFKCTSWCPHEKFGHAREVSFQHPIKIYFGARFGSCREVQKYRIYKNDHFIVDTSQQIDDVPYGDYFTVEGRWDVEKDGNESKPGCILRVFVNVAFSKKTMWRGKIVQSTIEECREVYATWIDLAHEALKKKKLEKEEGAASASISNGSVIPEKKADTLQFTESKASDTGLSQIVPDLNETDQQVSRRLQRPIGQPPSTGYPLRDSFLKFSTSLKHMNTPSLILVVTIAVILVLMQISIIVLLSRPQRIHLVSQPSCASSMHESRAEAFTSLSKRIKLLDDEMQLVETLMEKMKLEHAQLRGKLKELELFRHR